jgi:hypothetical protein
MNGASLKKTKSPMSTTELLGQVKQLPPREQLQLVEKIIAGLGEQLPATLTQPKPLRSLLGIWQGFTLTDEDIAEARHEMWGNFVKTLPQTVPMSASPHHGYAP